MNDIKILGTDEVGHIGQEHSGTSSAWQGVYQKVSLSALGVNGIKEKIRAK